MKLFFQLAFVGAIGLFGCGSQTRHAERGHTVAVETTSAAHLANRLAEATPGTAGPQPGSPRQWNRAR